MGRDSTGLYFRPKEFVSFPSQLVYFEGLQTISYVKAIVLLFQKGAGEPSQEYHPETIHLVTENVRGLLSGSLFKCIICFEDGSPIAICHNTSETGFLAHTKKGTDAVFKT